MASPGGWCRTACQWCFAQSGRRFRSKSGCSEEGNAGKAKTNPTIRPEAEQVRCPGSTKPWARLTSCSFLDEDRNTELIRWSDKGDSFIVVDEDEFARTLIPELFKHKNYASFVRQLNMYGFHKKVGLSDNSMRASERKDKSPSEYYHPYFRRGRSNLLWLIQKPKNPQGKGSGKAVTRSKQDDANMEDDGDEPYDIDSPAPPSRGPDNTAAQRSGQQPLLIGNANRGNSGRGVTPSQDELAAIHQELAEVRKNQKVISEVLQQMARENERRAQAYQTLHDRHENSINAMLTFLATVYNRSLSEGQGVQNFGNVLAGSFPQDAQQQGSVVDMGDFNEHNVNQTQPLFKRQPLLLKAPPSGNNSTAATPNAQPPPYLSPNAAQQPPFSQQSGPDAHSPHIQEIHSPATSNRSSQSPKLRASKNGAASEQQQPEADIMSLINSHNAQNTFPPGTRMDFPEALSHLQTADGKTPLTPNQRNNVLQLMAGSSAESGNDNNALASPNPPQLPETNQFDLTREQLEFLGNAIKDQEQKVGNLTQSLAPLSPSGSIPGMGGDGLYNGSDSLLDIDSIFNSGDYFNDQGTEELDFTNGEIPDFDFGTAATGDADGGLANMGGYDGAADERSERDSGVETLGSSEVASPAVTVEDAPEEQEEDYGRGKRRRKN